MERKRSDVCMCESKERERERERDVRHREYARMKNIFTKEEDTNNLTTLQGERRVLYIVTLSLH